MLSYTVPSTKFELVWQLEDGCASAFQSERDGHNKSKRLLLCCYCFQGFPHDAAPIASTKSLVAFRAVRVKHLRIRAPMLQPISPKLLHTKCNETRSLQCIDQPYQYAPLFRTRHDILDALNLFPRPQWYDVATGSGSGRSSIALQTFAQLHQSSAWVC